MAKNTATADLMTKVRLASLHWNEAPVELIELRERLHFVANQLDLRPMEFGVTLLTANETRGNILMQALKRIYADEKFWCVSSSKETLTKTSWACRHLGIETNPDVVHGKCSMEENLVFWRKVLNAIPDNTAGTPEEVKLWMESSPANSEAKLTWEEFIESVTERIMKVRVDEPTDVPQITLDDIGNLEKLHINGMTSFEIMEQLKSGVEKVMMGKLKLNSSDQYVDEQYKRNVNEMRDLGQEICAMINDFLEFMKINDNFNSKKTEFLLCHVDTVLGTMNSILKMHRNFVLGITM